MTIDEFVLKYNLEPIAKVKRIMPSGLWGETKLDQVVSVADKEWLVNNFCQISLASFENLLILDLTNCESSKPCADFFESNSLVHLGKMGGKLKLNKSFGKLAQIKEVHLSAVHVTSLPKNVGDLTTLKSLLLSDTVIKKLPPSFSELHELKEFKVWSKLQELPEELPKSLEVVDLRSNKLTKIPGALMRLPNLKWLDLSSNPFTSLTLPDMPNGTLEELGLARSPFGLSQKTITEVQKAFPNAKISGGASNGKFVEDGKSLYLSCTKLYHSMAHPEGSTSSN